ncbi:MAG: ankyrin repeat domain-containing protein [Phycisphaerales bacterium JB041]
MSNQKTNSVLVFVAVLVAAIIVIYAIMSSKPKTQPPIDGTVPAAADGDTTDADNVAEQAGTGGDVTRIDQTTDTTHGEVPAGGESDEGSGEPSVDETPAADPTPAAEVPSTLIEAAQAGDLPVLSAMIDSGMNVNATDEGGRTPLMHAAAGGHLDAVFALLNAGANAGLRDNARRAARDYALARADEPGQTIARILEDAVGPPPVRDASEK